MKDSFNVNKSQASAELFIYGKNINLEEISMLLGLEISEVRNKGDYRPNVSKGVTVSPVEDDTEVALWIYKTEEKGTNDIAIQVDELIAVFKDKVNCLKEIRNKYKDCTMEVCIVLYNHQRLLPGFALSAEQIAFLASIGVGIDFDIYLS